MCASITDTYPYCHPYLDYISKAVFGLEPLIIPMHSKNWGKWNWTPQFYFDRANEWKIHRHSKRGEEAYQKLVRLNALDIQFYKAAKRLGEALLKKYKVKISDPTCMQLSSYLPKNVEHIRGKLTALMRISGENNNKGGKSNRRQQRIRTLEFGNTTSTIETLCIARKTI